jgi:hypothetical protein
MTKRAFILIHRPGLSAAEIAAASKALERFRAFDIGYDVRPLSDKAVKGVKMGAQFLEALGTKGPMHMRFDRFLVPRLGDEYAEAIMASQRGGLAIGVGLTDEPIFLSVNSPRDRTEERVMGANRYRGGALVSVAGLRGAFGFDRGSGEYGVHPETAMRALELAVCHEAGHVLIETYGRNAETLEDEWHCGHPNCLMRAAPGIEQFVRQIVNARLDFCKGCIRLIQREIELLHEPEDD